MHGSTDAFVRKYSSMRAVPAGGKAPKRTARQSAKGASHSQPPYVTTTPTIRMYTTKVYYMGEMPSGSCDGVRWHVAVLADFTGRWKFRRLVTKSTISP